MKALTTHMEFALLALASQDGEGQTGGKVTYMDVDGNFVVPIQTAVALDNRGLADHLRSGVVRLRAAGWRQAAIVGAWSVLAGHRP